MSDTTNNDYSNSPLANPDFLRRASAQNQIAEALNSSDTRDTLVTAAREGNELAGEGSFAQDILGLNHAELEQRYGREVADNRFKIQDTIREQHAIQNSERSGGEVVADTALAGGAGFVGLVGSLESAALQGAGAVDEFFNPENTGLGEFGVGVAQRTSEVTEAIKSFQSQKLQDRKRISAIEGELDALDSAAQEVRELAEGASPLMAGAKRIGRDILNTGERILSDQVVAGDIISEAIGSLGPSAKLAQGGAAIGGRVAGQGGQAAGAALGVGVSEAAGVLSEASQAVMNLSHDQLNSGSEVYRQHIQAGLSPEQAQMRVAVETGREAFARQLPVATALGLIASKFETNPVGAFAGSDFMSAARQIGIQTLEESGQGSLGTFNQNVAIRNNANEDQSLIEGVGDALATGAIAGAGMSAALGSPAIVSQGVVSASNIIGDALDSDTTRAVASNTASVVRQAATSAAEVTQPLRERGVAVLDQLQSLAEGVDTKAQNTNVAAARESVVLAQESIETGQASPEFEQAITNLEESITPETLTEVQESSTFMESISKLTESVFTKGFKPSEAETAYIASQFSKLKGMVQSMPNEVRNQVNKILSSPQVRKITNQAKEIDLNKTQDIATDLTDDVMSESISVAKVNPTNVNPEVANKILKESGERLSPDDVRILESASTIAQAVNNHLDRQVEISKDRNITLTKIGQAPKKELTAENVSRNLRVEGYTDRAGNSLRSINDFASDIFTGAQSVDGTFVNDKGQTIPVAQVMQQFSNFVQHMNNKVGALNESFTNNNELGRGPRIGFRGLVNGNQFVDADKFKNPVAYHASNPNSVHFAQQVENDAKVAVEVYNQIKNTFPDLFGSFSDYTPVDLLTSSNEVVEVSQEERSETNNQEQGEQDANNNSEVDDTTTSTDDSVDSNQVSNDRVDEGENSETVQSDSQDGSVDGESEVSDDTQDNGQTEGLEFNSNPIREGVHESFLETYQEIGGQPVVSNLEDYLEKATGSVNTETLATVKKLSKPLIKLMNDRIANKKINKTTSLLDALKEGKVQTFRQYRNTAIVDADTGLYNQAMIEQAVIALVDWMMLATGRDPSRMDEALEELGVSYDSLTEQQINAIAYGIPPAQVKDQLGRNILRFWNVEENLDAPLGEVEGIVQGVASELLTALTSFTTEIDGEKVKLISIEDIPTTVDGKTVKTQTIVVKGLKNIQKESKDAAQDGLPLTAGEFLFEDVRETYSIGKKINGVARTQLRSGVRLSEVERNALKKMQDTPHYKDEGRSALFDAVGGEALARIFGYKNEDSIINKTLLNSVKGKNLSIELDLENTASLIDALADGETPVYYPVAISKVGRHQYQGVNPQSNKVLRALVTPTWSDLSFNKDDMNSFWLGVAQASDLYKVEKKDHDEILNTVQDTFNSKYRPAVDMVKEWLQTGEINGELFADAMGIVEPQQIAAVHAVAEMEFARQNGANSFRTSLSFELDGLTNGAANMMVNYGQGEITPKDFGNFNRIGLFLGRTNTTVNDFFKAGNIDLYETTSRSAEAYLYSNLNNLNQKQKDVMLAAGRFAARFGNFKVTEDGLFEMTRNTAKNPMTKVNYGSGVQGVGFGIADDMIIEFYNKIQGIDANTNYAEFFGYPEIQKDIAALFGGELPSDLGSGAFEFNRKAISTFRTNVSESIGTVLTESTKSVVGDKITEINDMLVFSTNIQSQYLQLIFDSKLEEIAEKRAKEGKIRRDSKTNKPIFADLSRRDYQSVVKELEKQSPIFVSDDQTLAIGGFKKKNSKLVLSSNMDESLNQKAQLAQPEDVGVRSIPYSVIGSGDAMMMNFIFGSEGAPSDVLGIFDGLDVPVSKVKEYAPYVNQQVLKTWERDVLAMAVQNFEGFLSNVGSDPVLEEAFAMVKERSVNSSVRSENSGDLLSSLQERHRQNQARKAVLKRIPLSVDQMGGSDVGYTRGDGEMDLGAINYEIHKELNNLSTKEEDVKIDVRELTVDAVVKSLRLNSSQKKVMEAVLPYIKNVRIVIGSLNQLNAYRSENFADDGLFLDGIAQYDVNNNVIYSTTTKPDTILHEMVHAATFNKVLDHYEGNSHDAVVRLESLMQEFLALDNKQNSFLEAKSAILTNLAEKTPTAKAAAINEFMAYALTNSKISDTLKNTKTNTLKSLSQKVIAMMRKLMGGIPQNMFDQTLFNVRVLNQPPIDNGGSGDGNNNGGDGNGSDGENTPPAENYTNFWIDLIKNHIQVIKEQRNAKISSGKEIVDFYKKANSVVDGYRQAGMLTNENARQTFKAIYMVMAAEMNLDSNSVIAMTKVFQHIEQHMTPEMFGPSIEDAQAYSAVINSFGSNQTGNTSDAIAVLLGLSQTSKKFRNVLDQLPDPEGNIQIDGSLNSFLAEATSGLMRKVMGSIDIDNKDVLQTMDSLADSLINLDTEKEYSAARMVTSSLDAADKFVADSASQLIDVVASKSRELKANTRSEFAKTLLNTVTLGAQFVNNSEQTANEAKRITHMNVPILSLVPIREFVSEVIGTDKTNAPVVALMDEVNSKISGMRQAYREDLPGILQNLFETVPVAKQWSSMFNTLGKTDFTKFVDTTRMDASMKALEFNSDRKNRIKNLEKALDNNYLPYIAKDAKDKAQQLANFINGQGAGNLLIRNAYALAKTLDGDFQPAMVDVIDELVTMYAIEGIDSDVRETTVQLWQNEPKAITGIITYIQGLNEAEDQKAGITEAAKLNAYKGFIPNHGDKSTQVIIADSANEDALNRRGYTKIGTYEGSLGKEFEQSYYVTNTRQSGAYSQGVMQNVQSTYRGVDINTGLTVTGETSGLISDTNVVNDLLDDMNDEYFVQADDKEALIPVFDEDGNVSAFERAINPDVYKTVMNQEENLAVMLGAWAGRHVEEMLASQYNRQLVDHLVDVWNNREIGTEEEFIDLGDTKEPIYAESFRLIPQEIKDYMNSQFGSDGIMVRKDMANLSVGYREASMADMWSGKTRLPKPVQNAVVAASNILLGNKYVKALSGGKSAFELVVKGEQFGQGVVSSAKDIIVIRSLIVPMANTKANVIQLATRGVPTKQIIKGFRSKLREVEEYNNNITKKIELEAKLRLAANNPNQKRIIENRIQVIEDLNNRMSIAPIVEAGAYKNLSEGITDLDVELSKGRIGDYIENLSDKLPDNVSNVVKLGLVSKSTKLYQVANRATQYGDFLAKSIYYDHLIDQGLSDEDAITKMNEEFVNFSNLPGRTRSYLETVGLTWFMAFKIRVMKIAFQMLKENPVRSLAVNAGLPDVGSPIQDNIMSVTLDGRLDYATGYEMLFSAPELNPWVNLLSE